MAFAHRCWSTETFSPSRSLVAVPPSLGTTAYLSSETPIPGKSTSTGTKLNSTSAPGTTKLGLPTSSPTTGATGRKKGLCYNSAELTNVFGDTGVSWAYNWASTPGGTLLAGMEYVPMLPSLPLSTAQGFTWNEQASAALSTGSRHLLSFNEPDLSSQANLTPAAAAGGHIQYLNGFSGQARIGSPAVTNGISENPPMGLAWLEAFFQECRGRCAVDFIAFHWYNNAYQLADLQNLVEDVTAVAQRNNVTSLWLTEFGASGEATAVESFLAAAANFLDQSTIVERYSYFMCSDGSLLQGTSLSPLGKVYIES